MKWVLVSTSNFERGLKRLSSVNLDRARITLEEIVLDPYSFKELKGRLGELRSARFGTHRIIYTPNEKQMEIVLLSVEQRSSVYKR